MLQPCGDLVDVVQQSEQYRQQCIDVIIRKLGPYSRISEPAINMESLTMRISRLFCSLSSKADIQMIEEIKDQL